VKWQGNPCIASENAVPPNAVTSSAEPTDAEADKGKYLVSRAGRYPSGKLLLITIVMSMQTGVA
jgi:hypothetical protein